MTLQEIMDAANVAVEITEGPDHRRLHRGEKWEHNAYAFRLTLRGEVLVNHGPYVAGMAHDFPTAADVFGAVVSDVQHVAPYMETEAEMDANVDAQTRQACHVGFAPAGWEEWASDMGETLTPAAAVASMRAFQEMVSRAALLRDRMSPREWEALLNVEI